MTNSTGINSIANMSVNTQFPARPGHGTLGKVISVYANYYKINVPAGLSLTRYNVEVSPAATGKKLTRIFQLLLEVPEFVGVATEWKSMVVTPNLLSIPADYTVQIPYRAEGQDEPLERATTYTIRVVTPLTFSISNLVSFLASDSPGQNFTQKLEIIQVMNAVFGHHPKTNQAITSIGASRHFSLDRGQANAHNIRVLGGGLEALRGYFQSVRPATGGLLLNVNVTHGVFFESVILALLYPRLGTGNKVNLQKKLKLLRVKLMHLPVKKNKANQEIPRVKTIFSLAYPQDGRNEDHPPQISQHGAGPKDVKFWLSEVPPGAAPAAKPPGKGKKARGQTGGSSLASGPSMASGQYVSVFTYFGRSKLTHSTPWQCTS